MQENNIVKHTPSEICCATYIVLVPAIFFFLVDLCEVMFRHTTDKTCMVLESSKLILR